MFGEQPVKRADPQAGRRRNQAPYRGAGRCWETPWDLFHRLDAEFHFTIDVCATEANKKVDRFFSEQQNGLLQSWTGEVCWMNPPYGAELPSWTKKARESGSVVVGLLPASTDTAWFHEDVLAARAEIRYLRGRVRFKVGEAWASPFQPNVIVVWRPTNSKQEVSG